MANAAQVADLGAKRYTVLQVENDYYCLDTTDTEWRKND